MCTYRVDSFVLVQTYYASFNINIFFFHIMYWAMYNKLYLLSKLYLKILLTKVIWIVVDYLAFKFRGDK